MTTIAMAAAFLVVLMAGVRAQQGKPVPAASASADPYAWLEDVTGDKALTWVKARNAESTAELASTPAFQQLKKDLLAILDSSARIPYVSKRGPYFYNFWRDAKNPKGLWRRTTLEEYRKTGPQVGRRHRSRRAGQGGERELGVGRRPDPAPGLHACARVAVARRRRRQPWCASSTWTTRTFVKDGFALPEAKGGVSWIDKDHVYVSTDFGPGSMTTSGYPRIAKLWTRGTPLSAATTVYEGQPTDMSISAVFDDTPGFERHFVSRAIAFYKSETFLRKADGALVKIDVPDDAMPNVQREWLMVELRSPGRSAARPTRPARCSSPGSTTSSRASATSPCSSSRRRPLVARRSRRGRDTT